MNIIWGLLFAYNTWATVYEIQHQNIALAALVGACAVWSLIMLVREVAR